MDGFLIIVAIYVVLTVLGAIGKKQKEEQKRRAMMMGASGRPDPGALPPEVAARLGVGRSGVLAGARPGEVEERGLSTLQRALRELERAEAEAAAARRGRVAGGPSTAARAGGPLPQRAPARLSREPASAPSLPGVFGYESEAEAEGEEGQEEIFEVEAMDLDEESLREAEARRRVARSEEKAAIELVEEGPERGSVRVSVAPKVAPKVVPTVAVTVEERAESGARNASVAPGRSAAQGRSRGGRSPLARFATGRVRDAVVLAEILQRPLGERS